MASIKRNAQGSSMEVYFHGFSESELKHFFVSSDKKSCLIALYINQSMDLWCYQHLVLPSLMYLVFYEKQWLKDRPNEFQLVYNRHCVNDTFVQITWSITRFLFVP